MVLVDTNVILDLVTDDPRWADWSQAQLEQAASEGPLLINPIIYAELSVAFQQIEALDAVLERGQFSVEAIPRHALFLAGKAFFSYRQRKGSKQGVLPDFFIGAHASVLAIPLLTRDVGRYSTYFPDVTLRTPVHSGHR